MTYRKKISKKKAQQKHVQKRSAQRFGTSLSSEKQEKLIRKIQWGEGRIVKRQSLRVTIHDVELDGTIYRCVYDKLRKSLATVLTTDMDPPNEM